MDQAEGLRELARRKFHAARVLAVTSGKGGVGKTNVAVNLAVLFAHTGRRVVLLDLDLGLANADVLLDVAPRWNLSHVVSGKKDIMDVLVAAPGGLLLVPGASGLERMANLSDAERDRLLEHLERLQRSSDLLVVDTGAGISRNVTAFAGAADDALVVTTPEPTSLIDAYASVKMIAREGDGPDVRLLVNMAADPAEADRVGAGVAAVAHRFLNAYVARAGYVLSDPCVPAAVRRRRAFVLEYPDAPASWCLRNIARGFWTRPAPAPARPHGFFRRVLDAITGRARPADLPAAGAPRPL